MYLDVFDRNAFGTNCWSRVPHDVAAKDTIPALVLSGGDSPVPLQQVAKAAAQALPAAEFRLLDGQTHDPDPDVLAAALAEFFA